MHAAHDVLALDHADTSTRMNGLALSLLAVDDALTMFVWHHVEQAHEDAGHERWAMHAAARRSRGIVREVVRALARTPRGQA